MECFYINLDSAHERRIQIESNFLENRSAEWRLSRYSAIDTGFIESKMIAGSLRPSEKACFFSHKYLIRENLHNKNPIFIMEDDVVFGKHTCAIVKSILSSSINLDWDILYTDIAVTQIATMCDLVKKRQRQTINNEIILLDLADITFAGSTSYILNPNSTSKIFNYLDAKKELNIPYDLYLRQLIHESKIKGYSFFPFITSLSEFSDISQIQQIEPQAADLIWNLFRKMIWLERDLEQHKQVLEYINQNLCDEESKMFGTLFSAMISKNFKPK
ncbi:MAG TPA: glycosyltransferase family 25 protein [Methylococcales bacterium]